MPELHRGRDNTTRIGTVDFEEKIVQVDVDTQTRKAFQGDEKDVVDTIVVGLRRRGKALLIDLSNGVTMMIHLRMTGQLIWRGIDERDNFAAGHPSKNFMAELPNSQTRVSFVFEEGALYFNDQRKFGFVKVLSTEKVEEEKFIRELGKRALGNDDKGVVRALPEACKSAN